MTDAVTIYQIRLGRHRPANIQPTTLAMSWGSDVTAQEAVNQIFGCIPFPYHLYVDVADTPAGLEKRLARMHDPQRLFNARQERIKKRLAHKDPLFYDQFVGPALQKDTYTLDYYRTRQREIEAMHRKVAVKPDQVGRIWINPVADRLRRFDWQAMGLELRDLVINKMDVYEAQDLVLEKHGVK